MLSRFLFLIWCALASSDTDAETKTKEMENILFPSRYYVEETVGTGPARRRLHPQSLREEDPYRRTLRLETPSDYDADEVTCSNCNGLEKCSVLNGLLVEERYYPVVNQEFGTCRIIEALGVRMSEEIFGVGKTFRDTQQCQEIVMQYLCLFWGSQNDMYRNYCYWSEDVSSPDPRNHLIAPRPPCRSFCVQIAEVCANEYDFLDICNNILCPPTEDECTPDPMVDGQLVAAGIGCYVPFLKNPYGAAALLAPSKLLCFISILCTFAWVL